METKQKSNEKELKNS